jgi:hypothetical protein
MASYDDLAALMPSASPLASNNIDPDDAVANREQVLAQLAARQNGLTHPVANTSGTLPDTVAAPAPWTPQPKGPPATNAPTPPSESASDPSVPGSVTPSGDSQTASRPASQTGIPGVITPIGVAPPKDFYGLGQTAALETAQAAQRLSQRWQSRPLTSATTDPLEAARIAASSPTPSTGADGKLLPQYRPSVGQRIVRGVQAAVQGGIPGVLTADYGGPNSAYNAQENARKADLASLDQQVAYRQKAATLDNTQLRDVGTANTNASSRFNATAQTSVTKQNADTTAGKPQSIEEQAYAYAKSQGANPMDALSQVYGAKNVKDAGLPQQYLDAIASGDTTKANLIKQVIRDTSTLPKIDIHQAEEKAPGVLMMVPDGKGGSVATMIHPGDTVAPGSTTAAQVGSAGKADKKATDAAQQVVDDAETAHQLAKEAEGGNAPADVDLALAFFKAMKGSNGSGIRFTQAEQNLIMGARSSSGDLQGIAQKVIGEGQKFTPDQRNKILRVIDIHADQARKHLGGGSSNSSPGSSASGSFDWNSHPVVQ